MSWNEYERYPAVTCGYLKVICTMSEVLIQPQAKKCESIVNTLLDLPPSCIEFAPQTITPCSLRNCFIIGTYHLEPIADDEQQADVADKATGQKRSGSLVAYQLQGKNLYVL